MIWNLLLTLAVVGVGVLAVRQGRWVEKLRERFARLEYRYERAERDLRRARQQLYSVRAAELLRERRREPTMPVAFRSQFGEDLWLWDLFEGRDRGFFIEVGAYDGVTHSISYAFGAFGWTGLLIEALPERYEQCRAARRDSRVEHAALGRPGSPREATFVAIGTSDELLDMLSHEKQEGRLTEEDRRALERGGKTRREFTVPMRTMDELLGEHSSGVDWAVIDVEGAELAVFEGWDLDRYRPRVLVVEDNSLGADGTVNRHITGRGYVELGFLALNRVYVRADEPELLARARELMLVVPPPRFEPKLLNPTTRPR